MKKSIALSIVAGALFVSALPAENRVSARRENQQDRIAQGVKSGQLTAGETARLEKSEAKINHEVHADRKANGGTLTRAEKKQINAQQNRMSGRIYKEKHDAAVQPK